MSSSASLATIPSTVPGPRHLEDIISDTRLAGSTSSPVLILEDDIPAQERDTDLHVHLQARTALSLNAPVSEGYTPAVLPADLDVPGPLEVARLVGGRPVGAHLPKAVLAKFGISTKLDIQV